MKMKTWRFFGLAALVSAVTVVAIVLASVALFSPKAQRFDGYSDVLKSGLIEKGWIPEFLPKDAFNVIHQHDLDTGETVVEFSFKVQFVGSLGTLWRALPSQSLAEYQKEATMVAWDLKNVSNATFYVAEGFDRHSVLAIDDSSKRALYWETIKR